MHERPAVHTRPRRPHRVLWWTALCATGVVAFTGAGVGALAYRVDHNIEQVETAPLRGAETERPAAPTPDPDDPNAGVPLTIALIGSDDRSGENVKIGGKADGSMRSDVTMLMHVSADRSRVEIVSIPRDLVVDIPSCTVTGGGTTAPSPATKFNSAFSFGFLSGHDLASAAACTMRTIESATNVRVDGFIAVDFVGFRDMIDAIGGVDMCIPEPLADDEANLDLAAGNQHLDGLDALALARARHDLSDGSDTHRLDRQQALLAATSAEVLSASTLANPSKLLKFVDAVTSSLTLDTSLGGVKDLTGLGFSLRDIAPSQLTFMTAPTEPYVYDRNRVQFSADAPAFWARMAADEPVVESSRDVVAAASTPTADAGVTDDGVTDGGVTGGGVTDGVAADDVQSPTATPVDPLADRTPGEAITGADARTTC